MPRSKKHDDWPPPPKEEVELAEERRLGRPLAGNPAERIGALEKRIVYLADQRRRSELTDEPLKGALIRLTERELAEARRQLRDWRILHDGRN